jgi:hypothetical protein
LAVVFKTVVCEPGQHAAEPNHRRRFPGSEQVPEACVVRVKARIAAGCPSRIPHDFRRTTGRNLERKGISTECRDEPDGPRYAIVSSEDLRDASRPAIKPIVQKSQETECGGMAEWSMAVVLKT